MIVLLNDMHLLDVREMTWKQLYSGDVLGSPPSHRKGMGMAAVNNKIMIYGGTGNTGMLLIQFLKLPSTFITCH